MNNNTINKYEEQYFLFGEFEDGYVSNFMTRRFCGLSSNTPTFHEKGIYCLLYSHVSRLQTTTRSCHPRSPMPSPPLHSIVMYVH